MDFTSLRVFTQVAHSASFSAAAERLFLTQPAVSKRIAGLEAELSTPLFDRIGRQILLTEAGRRLLPRAEQVLEELADIRRELSHLSDQTSGTLSMATSHHIGLHRMPPILRRYVDRYPDVKLDIRFMESEKACQAVAHGELEMGVVTLPLAPFPQLEQILLWNDPLSFVASRDHNLSTQGPLSPESLLTQPAVLPTKGTYTRTLLEQILSPLELDVQCNMATDYLETLKMMTSIGLGWSLLPATMLDDELVELEVKGISLTRSLGVVSHSGRTLSNAAHAMLNLLSEAADGVTETAPPPPTLL